MSVIDYPAMLAQLEQQRTALEEEANDLDAVIDTLRRRAQLAVPAKPVPAAKPANRAKPKPKKPSGGNGGRASGAETDAAKAQAKKLWEKGTPVDQIAKTVGRAVGSIYAWSSDGKWQRPKPGAAAPAAAAPTKEPAGEKLSGSVRCTNPKCGSWTDYDPCRSCGQPLKRTW